MAAIDISQKLGFLGEGIIGTATRESSGGPTTSNFDYKISEDNLYLTGSEIIYQNCLWGDFITFQIIDIDNILGLGANTVLNEYVPKWYLDPDNSYKKVVQSYGGEIPKNVYIRVKYTAVDDSESVDAKVALNFYLHKVL